MKVTYQEQQIEINEDNTGSCFWLALADAIADGKVKLTDEQDSIWRDNRNFADTYYNAWTENYKELSHINLDNIVEFYYDEINQLTIDELIKTHN